MAAIAAAITAAIAATIAAAAPAARAVAAATAAGEIAAGAARRGTGDDRGRPGTAGGRRRRAEVGPWDDQQIGRQ